MTQIKVRQFEGPLDLLLSLIEEQKLDITQIALAEVTEQFLGYVKQLEQIDPTALSDYLAIAAKLLVIKSKAILPSLEVETDDDDEPEEDLTEKLFLYKQFKEVAKHLKKMDQQGNQSFTRTLVFSQRINFWPDPNVSAITLYDNIQNVVQALRELDNLPKAKVKEAVSIQERITHLQQHLSRQIETKLSDLLATSKNKGEVIITFLALLELIKQRMFTVDQNELFSDITITKYEYVHEEPVTEESEESEELTISEIFPQPTNDEPRVKSDANWNDDEEEGTDK